MRTLDAVNPFDVDSFLATGGLIGLCALIFVETGLLIGFIFPGDTVLFTAGVLTAQSNPFAPWWLLCIVVPASAVLGDQFGYLIGRRLGRAAVSGRVERMIGSGPIARTHAFFDRFGALTVFLGRFIGVVRTLVPVFAGFSGMSYRMFTLMSVLGSVVWAGGLIILGNLLGNVAIVRDNIDVFLIASVLTVVVPITVHLGKRWWRRRGGADTATEDQGWNGSSRRDDVVKSSATTAASSTNARRASRDSSSRSTSAPSDR
ncbi:membrane-associated protein [Williamsia sterculiae]|uniref:Membrane-associated protein n=1 Tax=Williamsia sterculiae TaxID=1344003 RepID=A0A1N7GST2_9NOCA|nr:membrane-associated protein [Williamsia sterculiae]